MQSAESQLLRAADAAAFVGIGLRTFWRLLAAEQIPNPIRLGQSRFWRRSDLQRWIDAGCPAADRMKIKPAEAG
jgi:predicted DNA-binding transcriptional regulator AlpA